MKNSVAVDTHLTQEDEELCLAIFGSVMRAYHRLHGLASNVASTLDLQFAQMNVIDMLGKLGPVSMGELARATFIAPSTTTRTVKTLEGRGLVKRQRSINSERVVTVSLTKEGEQVFARSYPQILRAVEANLEQRLSASDRRALAALLQKLVA